MKTKLMKGAALAALLTVCVSPAQAITLDGNAADWFNNTDSGYANWTPTAEVTQWVNHDGFYVTTKETEKWDNRAYDIEMGAFSAQEDGLFVMLVLSDINIWEDLAISVDGSDNFQYGVNLNGLQNRRDKVQNRKVYEVEQWKTAHGGYKNLPEWQIKKGNYIGDSQFIFSSLGKRDDNRNDFLVEGFISWALLGGPSEEVCIQFSEISCLRDSLNLCGPTGTNTEIPEPATMALLGTGLLGAAARRKRSKSANV